MLNVFQLFQRTATAKSIPQWDRFLAAVQTRIDLRLQRAALVSSTDTQGIRFCQALLMSVDTDRLLRINDATDLYFAIRDELPVLEQRVDILHTGSARTDTFFAQSNPPVSELLVHTKFRHESADLPMNASHEELQEMIELPITILSGPFIDLHGGVTHDQIVVTESPETSVISVNLTLLVLRWLAYVKEDNLEVRDERAFVHREVILPMDRHLVDLWIVSLLATILETPDEDMVAEWESQFCAPWMPANAFRTGTKELVALSRRLANSQIQVSDFVSTPFFFGGSLRDRVYSIERYHNFPDLRQREFLHTLIAVPYVQLLIRAYGIDSGDPTAKRARTILKRAISRLQRNGVASYARDNEVKETVSSQLNLLELDMLMM